MDSETRTWTDYFFSNYQPSFDLTNSSFDPETFQQFQYKQRHWRLGRRLDERDFSYREQPPALVRRLYAKTREGTVKYAAKTFLVYHEDQARMQLRRISSSRHSVDMVRSQLDPFLAEARAFEQIIKFCPSSRKVYFPRYHGVITNISQSRDPSPYESRPQAVVLEAISPGLASRRILSAEAHLPDEILVGFSQQLDKVCLSPFEANWYLSLFADRFRRVTTLHDIGISHGDLWDRHFRLPGDFYDTVLYDFSISYTFSPSWPYSMNFGRPTSLSRVKCRDRKLVEHCILERAEQRDFRSHLANSLQLSADVIETLCSLPPQEASEDLELIIIKVMHRPDEFDSPSLASVFPFLEAIRPEGHPTWHISRAQALDHYVSAWVSYAGENDKLERTTLISLAGEKHSYSDKLEAGLTFYLILIPQSWDRKEVDGKLLEACARLGSLGKPGMVITKPEFDNNEYGSGGDEENHAERPPEPSVTLSPVPS